MRNKLAHSIAQTMNKNRYIAGIAIAEKSITPINAKGSRICKHDTFGFMKCFLRAYIISEALLANC